MGGALSVKLMTERTTPAVASVSSWSTSEAMLMVSMGPPIVISPRLPRGPICRVSMASRLRARAFRSMVMGVLPSPSDRLSLGTWGPCGSPGKISQVEPLPPLFNVNLFNHFSWLDWKLWFPTWNENDRSVDGRVAGIVCGLPSTVSFTESRVSSRGVLVRLTRTSLAARNRVPVVL